MSFYFIIEIASKRWCCVCSCCNICPFAQHLEDYKTIRVFLGNGSYQGIIQRTIMRQIKYFVPLKRCLIWVRCWHNAVMTRINHIIPFIEKYMMNTSQNTLGKQNLFPCVETKQLKLGWIQKMPYRELFFYREQTCKNVSWDASRHIRTICEEIIVRTMANVYKKTCLMWPQKCI